ncbi:MAG: hypothetical protein FJ271_10670 [Planctomycetes bacterium]|nr:hypothetical protein [Planctomycetota bacterium]
MKIEPKATKLERVVRYERQMHCCRLSPDGAYLYGAGFDGRLHRWTLNQKDRHESFAAHQGWVETMVLHPDGSQLFTADSWGQVSCWPVGPGIPKRRWTIQDAHLTWLRRVTVSPRGDRIATCGNDHKVRVFSSGEGKLIRELTGHEHAVLSLAFHADGKSLTSGDLFGNVRHWDLSTGKCLRSLDASRLYKKFHQYDQGGVRCMTFDTAFRCLYCGGFEGTNANQAQGTPTVIALDWASGKIQTIMTPRNAFTGPILDVVYHPAGYLIGAGSSEAGGVLWFWKPGQAKNQHEVRYENSFRGLDLHRNGARLAAAAFGDRGGQRGGNGRRLTNGEYVGFEGSIALYTLA